MHTVTFVSINSGHCNPTCKSTQATLYHGYPFPCVLPTSTRVFLCIRLCSMREDAGYRMHSLSCMVHPAGVVGVGIAITSKTIVEKTRTMSSLLHIWAHADVYIQYAIDMFCTYSTRSGNISPSCALAIHVSQTGCPRVPERTGMGFHLRLRCTHA